jgi:hypothetical protein
MPTIEQIIELRQLADDALQAKGFAPDQASWLANHVLNTANLIDDQLARIEFIGQVIIMLDNEQLRLKRAPGYGL